MSKTTKPQGDGAEFHLQEALIHLQSLLGDMRAGTLDDSAYEVDMAHIQEHLCLAWNLRHVGSKPYVGDMEENKLMARTIPNWTGVFHMEDSQG